MLHLVQGVRRRDRPVPDRHGELAGARAHPDAVRRRGARGLHDRAAHHHRRDPAVVGDEQRGGDARRPEPRGAASPSARRSSVWLVGVYNMVFLLGVMAVVPVRGPSRSSRVFTPDPQVLALGARLPAHRELRLRLLRLGHGDGAGVQRRGRHADADLDQPRLLLVLPDPARAGAGARAGLRAERASSSRSRSRSRRWRSSACWPSAAGRGSGRWREGQRRMSRTWLATTRSATSYLWQCGQ